MCVHVHAPDNLMYCEAPLWVDDLVNFVQENPYNKSKYRRFKINIKAL